MGMIQINGLSLQYGDKHIFRDVSARLNDGDRVGLVGVNGTGKSTLLKIMTGEIEIDFGVISRSKRATIGYLPQEIQGIDAGRGLYEEAQEAYAGLLAIDKELEKINRELGAADPQSPGFADLLRQQGELQQRLDDSDFFQMEAKIVKVLTGLGFGEHDFAKPCGEFSGGWQMRIMLAKLLLQRPAFLFLDEPTNHLDIESLTWLEDFLQSYKGAFVIISHDRAFLDNLTTVTWELSLGRLTVYKGNYSAYVKEKAVRMEVRRAAYDNQQAKIQQTMRFVTRFRAKSTKAKQVQSRLKQLAKMERIELEQNEQAIGFRFPPALPGGRLAVAAEGLAKAYDGREVLKDISFEVNRGDKVAVVGVNGAGKSTLARLLAGRIAPDAGSVRQGHNVKISYFGQHQAQELSPGLTVLRTMELAACDHTVTGIRSLLGAFLFRGDEVDKKVMVLSGGEKSRLALAKMIATPANLLIMDEPTNHLDMMSQEVLQEALRQYDGSVVVVSHNRYFLDAFVNKVLEIKDGGATMYEGNLAYYLEKTEERRGRTVSDKAGEAPSPTRAADRTKAPCARPRGGRLSAKEERRRKARLREEKNRVLAPLLKKLAGTESEIERLEEEKSALERQLADPGLYRDQEAFAEKSAAYKTVERRLERLYPKWEAMQEERERVEGELAAKAP